MKSTSLGFKLCFVLYEFFVGLFVIGSGGNSSFALNLHYSTHTHTHGLISEATLLGNWEKYQAAMQENMKVALTKGAC